VEEARDKARGARVSRECGVYESIPALQRVLSSFKIVLKVWYSSVGAGQKSVARLFGQKKRRDGVDRFGIYAFPFQEGKS
jgi:hypothetical protein